MEVDSAITIKYENLTKGNIVDNSDCISTITKDKDGESKSNAESKDSKKPWLLIEDNRLMDLIDQYGVNNWAKVAEMLTERSGKQCRERWHNHLNPEIKKGDWTMEEDRIIVTMQTLLGNQWAKITKMLPGRTDNAVKNRFHATERARAKGTNNHGSVSVDDSYAIYYATKERLQHNTGVPSPVYSPHGLYSGTNSFDASPQSSPCDMIRIQRPSNAQESRKNYNDINNYTHYNRSSSPVAISKAPISVETGPFMPEIDHFGSPSFSSPVFPDDKRLRRCSLENTSPRPMLQRQLSAPAAPIDHYYHQEINTTRVGSAPYARHSPLPYQQPSPHQHTPPRDHFVYYSQSATAPPPHHQQHHEHAIQQPQPHQYQHPPHQPVQQQHHHHHQYQSHNRQPQQQQHQLQHHQQQHQHQSFQVQQHPLQQQPHHQQYAQPIPVKSTQLTSTSHQKIPETARSEIITDFLAVSEGDLADLDLFCFDDDDGDIDDMLTNMTPVYKRDDELSHHNVDESHKSNHFSPITLPLLSQPEAKSTKSFAISPLEFASMNIRDKKVASN